MPITVRLDAEVKDVNEAVERRLGTNVLETAKAAALQDALQSTGYLAAVRNLNNALRTAYLQRLRTILRDETFRYEDETPIPESVVRRARRMGESESTVPDVPNLPAGARRP